MSQETLDSNIKRLLEINEERASGSKSKFSLNDLNLYKLQCVETVNGVNFLVRKDKFGNSTGKRFVSIENMFSVIHEEHTKLSCPGRDIMVDKMKNKYANVTTDLINIYKDTCLKCGLKQSRIRKNVVVKPIRSSDTLSRWQVDLIDMQSQPIESLNGEKRFISVIQDNFS